MVRVQDSTIRVKMLSCRKLPLDRDSHKENILALDVDPVPRQLLTRAESFFGGLFFLTLSDKLTRGQVPK